MEEKEKTAAGYTGRAEEKKTCDFVPAEKRSCRKD